MIAPWLTTSGLERRWLVRVGALIASATLGACHGQALEEGQTRALKAGAAAEARLQAISKIRLDAPLTANNSVPFTFEDGPTLRIPKILLDPATLPPDPNQPFRARALALSFWYPDLTLVDPRSVPRRGTPGYEPQTGRFWVWILYMWYVRPDSDSFIPGSQQPDVKFGGQRPPRIAINTWCIDSKNGRCDAMGRLPSGIAGIDSIISSDWIKKHPEVSTHRPEQGGVYIARPDSPYELFMDCDAFTSLRCDAHVYSKKHHLQYRMNFPPESVARIDELIKAIDKMLDTWPPVKDSTK